MTEEDQERQIRAWARTIMRRTALRWVQRQQNNNRSVSLEDKFGVLNLVTDLEDFAEATWWTQHCWNQLNDRQRQVFAKVRDGFSPAEIARQFQCDPSTIRRVVYQIRKQCPYPLSSLKQ